METEAERRACPMGLPAGAAAMPDDRPCWMDGVRRAAAVITRRCHASATSHVTVVTRRSRGAAAAITRATSRGHAVTGLVTGLSRDLVCDRGGERESHEMLAVCFCIEFCSVVKESDVSTRQTPASRPPHRPSHAPPTRREYRREPYQLE